MTEQPNLEYINQLSGDDMDFKQQFITILKEEFPLEKEVYYDHVENARLKQTADIVHKIKHKFNILGLHNSYEVAVRYEKELLEGRTHSETEFKSILKKVETYLDII
ncbi:Hpt domain-containing protein [Maribacter aurantiacus]|uniref:Hpt domain-containing protein n=1 Tax=Maribacter aurantiacus TaxID=1882343 RepID=A0A5R8M4E9_9FLAO|nr:Hpt domain-containing protein [Maribacter aurantiacus]TLF44415.1 Hpt domain-containing protein [Maribacter aurantiacus]